MIQIFMEMIPSSLLQGLLLSIVVMGMIIPFKLLNFPDLTPEGSYPFGGVACASLMILGLPPLLSLVLASVLAGILGIFTALIHIKYKVNTLLAGIIISTMIYSVNLRILGKPNMALFNYDRIFKDLSEGVIQQIIIILMINIFIFFVLRFFLVSEKGLQFRAVGLNSKFAKKQGIFINRNIIFGLFIGNMLCGLSGGLLVQIQGYADISMGIGIVIHALAAMMIGERIIGSDTINKIIIFPIIGSLIYQQIQGAVLSIGFAPSDLKFFTGAMVLMIISSAKKKYS